MHCFGNIYKIRWVLCESFAIETRLIHLKDDSYSPSSSPFSVDARFTRRMQTHFSTRLTGCGEKREEREKKKEKKQSEIWCVKLPFRCSQMAIFTLPCHCKVGESPGAWSWEGEPVLLKTNRAQNIPHSCTVTHHIACMWIQKRNDDTKGRMCKWLTSVAGTERTQ